MTEEVGVNMLCDPGLFPILLDDLLDASGREQGVTSRLEEIAILGIGAQMTLQHQAKAGRKQDIAGLPSLALRDKYFALRKVDIGDFDLHQFTDPNRREEEQLEHDLMLQVAALLEHTEEFLESRLWQELRQLALFGRFAES